MKYKVSVIKKIAFLVMTMALAPGKAGEPGEPGEPGEAGGVPPRSIEDIADVSLKLAGPMATKAIVVTNNFKRSRRQGRGQPGPQRKIIR